MTLRCRKKAKKFVPKKFKGTWSGTWKNLTFDTSGKASIRLEVRGSKKKPVMSGTFRLGGNAFGCDSIPPRPVKMKKGKGKNRWNSGGFKAAWNNGQGPVRISYNHRKGKLSGSGVSPCDFSRDLRVQRQHELAFGQGERQHLPRRRAVREIETEHEAVVA